MIKGFKEEDKTELEAFFKSVNPQELKLGKEDKKDAKQFDFYDKLPIEELPKQFEGSQWVD